MIAESDDAVAIAAEINGVTRDGEKCSTFEECVALIEAGEDIDYDGAAGALELDDAGDPTVGRYAIGQFNADGGIDILGSQDVEL